MDNIFVKIADDLKITKFDNESDTEYMQRLTYSAISCWIKAISLDQFVGQANGCCGVSKKHLTEKAVLILNEYLNNFPTIKEWFVADKDIKDAVKLLENRLYQSGDLCYIGFGTNVILSRPYEKQISKNTIQIIGKVQDDDAKYSGIAMLKSSDYTNYVSGESNHFKGYKDFILSCKWTQGEIPSYDKEYFNPINKTSAVSKCWQAEKVNFVNGIRFVRVMKGFKYEYALERYMNNAYHYCIIDPFLIEQREHVRMLISIKKESGSSVKAKAVEFEDYIRLNLYTLLPKQESKWIELLAWPTRNVFDMFEWKIRKTDWDFIKNIILNTGISIQEVKNNG